MKGVYRVLSIVLVTAVIGSAIALGGTIGWFGMESMGTYYENKALTQTAYPTNTMTFTPSPFPTLAPTYTATATETPTPLEQMFKTGIFSSIPYENINGDTPFFDLQGLLSRHNENISQYQGTTDRTKEDYLYQTISDINAFFECRRQPLSCNYYPFLIDYKFHYNNDPVFKSQVDGLGTNSPTISQIISILRFYNDLALANQK